MLFKLNMAKFTTGTLRKIIMDLFFKSKAPPRPNPFDFKDNLDIETFKNIPQYRK
jgi:hypothetical protein